VLRQGQGLFTPAGAAHGAGPDAGSQIPPGHRPGTAAPARKRRSQRRPRRRTTASSRHRRGRPRPLPERDPDRRRHRRCHRGMDESRHGCRSHPEPPAG
jgi:hypothetical protein